MKITNKFMRKVRKSSRHLKGLTTLPNEKSLEEGWYPGSPTPTEATSGEFTLSTEFSVGESVDDCGVEGLPCIPKVTEEEEKDENQYYCRTERLVFFDEEVLVRRVRPVYQIGGMIDRRELWYQDDEYKEIMWKARRLVKRAHNDENNNEKYCLRGLEHVTNSIKRKSKSNFEGRDAVLDEQCDQFEKDVFPLDDNRISSIYIPYTKMHRAEAVLRAKFDAEDVALYQQAPSSTTPSSSRSLSSTHSSSAPQIHTMTQKSAKRSSLKGFSSANSLAPSSPSLVNKPGMMFTYIDKQIQYPPGMKLDKL